MTFGGRLLKARFLDALEGIEGGRLLLTTPDGQRLAFGDAGAEVDLEIRDWSFLSRLARRGDVGLGEAWVEGEWQSGNLGGLLELALLNTDRLSGWVRPGKAASLQMKVLDRVFRVNSLRGSTRNIRAHYDVGNEFYQYWLDRGMTYSSALFADGDDLETAQARKNGRILSRLAPGDSILEIGCGWGGFAEAAADDGYRVTGITLSPAQKGYADARLDGRVDIRLQDYRHVRGSYDNIVSIEMIEAVGERFWPVYFATIRDRLADGGRAVLQAITVPDEKFARYRSRSDFIRQHMFPGGMLPCKDAMEREAARAGLAMQNTFSFGEHYARTCEIWRERMLAEAPGIGRMGYSAKFLRAWRFYLDGCAATFRTGRTDVIQAEFVHAGAAAG